MCLIWNMFERFFWVLSCLFSIILGNSKKLVNHSSSFRWTCKRCTLRVKWPHYLNFNGHNDVSMDTVINVVPNADISKKHKITFFFNYIKRTNFCISKFYQDIFGCGTGPSSTKNWVFLCKMAAKDKKVTFCYISISHLKIEIR